MKGKLNQFYTTLACSFGTLVMGLANVWPSYTSSLYASKATPLTAPMTNTEDSLLGSLPSLGAIFGAALVGTLINKFGRKNGGLILSLFYVISWVLVDVSTLTTTVLAARFLVGIGGGGFLAYAPIFVSEIADDDIRGTLASGSLMLYCVGTTISYVMGWMLTYRVIIWMNIIFSVFCFLLIMFVTESPVYLIRQKKDQEALASIAKYRGLSPSSRDVLDDLSRLKQQIQPAIELLSVESDPQTKEDAEKEKLNSGDIISNQHKKVPAIKLLFCSVVSRRAFFVVCAVISAQVFMGMMPVQVYAKHVFTQTDPSRADLYTVLFSLTLVCGNVGTAIVADKAGRRVLIITSSVFVCICMSALGFLLQSKVAPPIVSVLFILFYCFSFMFGAGSVPYVLLAELFIPDVQNLASMLLIELVWFLNFVILALFPIMNSWLGMHGVFYTFAAVSLGNAIISFFIVPETKGLSNEQIQEVLLRRK